MGWGTHASISGFPEREGSSLYASLCCHVTLSFLLQSSNRGPRRGWLVLLSFPVSRHAWFHIFPLTNIETNKIRSLSMFPSAGRMPKDATVLLNVFAP